MHAVIIFILFQEVKNISFSLFDEEFFLPPLCDYGVVIRLVKKDLEAGDIFNEFDGPLKRSYLR
jgi:hypothetical protein